MKAMLAAVADSTPFWRARKALSSALRALVVVAIGWLVALAIAYLGHPSLELVAFNLGVILAMALGSADAMFGAFGWLVVSVGAYLLTCPDDFSMAAGGLFMLTGIWILVADVT